MSVNSRLSPDWLAALSIVLSSMNSPQTQAQSTQNRPEL